MLPNFVRIISRSRGQQVRGLRHLEFRPDLIVGDDIEDIDSVRQKEQRDKTEEWFLSDVIPALDQGIGKMILVGNLLHTDSLMSRIKSRNLGIIKEYPVIDDKGNYLWPSLYGPAAVKKIKEIYKDKGTRFWLREYMLKIVPEEGRIIKKVGYYSKLPEIKAIGIGTDLAISKKETADNSAINVLGQGGDGKYYNLKSEAGRWSFNETLEKIYSTYESFRKTYPEIAIFLGFEDVAYQRAAIEEFTRRYKVEPQSIKRTIDKRARLQAIEPYFVSEQIAFREDGDEDVVNEILNFGIEQHDDRMDAFEISLNVLINRVRPEIYIL